MTSATDAMGARRTQRLRIVSLFAGAGGEVLGAHRAGLEHVEAVEWDTLAADTLEAATGVHAPAHPDWSGPPLVVRRCSVADWTPPPADVWWASPPCQPDSIAGRRLGADDPRDGWPMVWEALDRAAARPRWMVCETVAGILRSTARDRWARIVSEFEARFAWVVWWLLNAADYGVPQHRRRVILVAGPGPVERPAPTHGDPATLPLFRPWVSMGEALGIVGELDGSRNTANHPRQERPRPLPMLRDPSPTVTANEIKGSTLCVRTDGRPRENRASCRLHAATGRRRLTVEECATLQGFPDEWPFQGTKAARYRQVGNAVPPQLAQVVLEAVTRSDCPDTPGLLARLEAMPRG